MAHLACSKHKKRSQIIWKDGQWIAIHRNNGSICDSGDFQIGDMFVSPLQFTEFTRRH
jgi:hypothetical protein